mgnify:CR=1 FL=1
MEWSLTQNKLLAFHRLMRTDKPIGALLLLWPTLWALWVATPGVPQLWILAVFVAGVWLMRAAGCVVNDYADRKFDGHVKRTANRPLPSGAVTEKEARALFVVLVLISFLLVLTLNTMTILLSIAALALAWVYPFMKRYTHLPQVVLGAAFGWSIPMAFAAVSESVPLSCWLMFLANILWAVAYDTQYAMVDRDDDVKIGIKSTAILFGQYDKLIIGILQIGVLALMAIIGELNGLGWGYYWSILVAGALFVYQQKLIANREREACFKAFMNNNYVGLVLFLPAYYLMVVAVIGLITGVTMKETANRPLKGATPAASDIQEAKEILVEHYDNIEQKIEDIDQEIADLQAKRSRLVQQHPRIND